MFLIHGLGGSVFSLNSLNSSIDWGTNFQKINSSHWTLTERDNKHWIVGVNENREFGAWDSSNIDNEGNLVTWPSYRCVRTVE